jgi:alanine dehydrogenase
MIIGILKERFQDEQRVALSPSGVESLVQSGVQILVETGAGQYARFTDEQYEKAGATVVYSMEEATGRADIVLKVMPPNKEEYEMLGEGQTLMSFLLLGMRNRDLVEHLIENKVTTIAYEYLRGEGGSFPIMRAMSDISGQISALVAARFLRSDQGGRGILLGGLAGVAPAAVVILGMGASGMAAAQAALGIGAQVIALDTDLEKLREAENYFGKRITTVMASPHNVRRGVGIADVLIGAISITEDQSHHIVTEEMVRTMKPGAVIIDISINQGGCVETSRPTTIRDPVFVKHGVIHYGVPNMPSMVARTATYALTNGLTPYLSRIAAQGIAASVEEQGFLRCGVVTHAGRATHRILQDLYGIAAEPFECGA